MSRVWPGELGTFLVVGLLAGAAHGEAKLDGTFGHLDSFSGDFTVPHTKGRVAGANLFHSFRTFNVQTGESATFTGPDDVANVIARVTGQGSAFRTTIDGRLTNIEGADFYLLNPNGVFIGENAVIDVSGSFHVSTGDYIRFADGERMYADADAASTFSAAAPEAFGFLDARADRGGIEMAGSPFNEDFGFGAHVIPDGEQWSLVGGDVRIGAGPVELAYLFSWDGRVNVVSVASAGEAAVRADGIRLDGVTALGRVDIVEGTLFDVKDIYVRAGTLSIDDASLASGYFTETGGVVDIEVWGDATIGGPGEFWEAGLLSATGAFGGFGRGPDLRVDVRGTLAVSGVASIASNTYADGRGGDVYIRAGRIEVHSAPGIVAQSDGTVFDDDGNPVGIAPTGDAGNLTIETGTLALLGDGAQLSASTNSTGRAGTVLITASESVTTTGRNSGVFSSTRGAAADIGAAPGDAGNITVRAPLLRMDGPGRVEAATTGDGNAGSVLVDVDRLELTGGAQVRTFSGSVLVSTGELIVGSGDAGAVEVRASESVSLSGVSETGAPSALSSQSRGAGAGGEIRVTTPSLTLSDQALIGAGTGGDGDGGNVVLLVENARITGGARVSADSGINVSGLDLLGGGDGGTVKLTATGAVTLSGAGSAISTSTLGSGHGGDVTVDARTVSLRDDGAVRASSLGTASTLGAQPGSAGTVRVTATDAFENVGGVVSTEAVEADGGDIKVTAGNLVHLLGGKVTTSVLGAGGTGGNIDIDPQFVVLQGASVVSANARNPQAVRAGNITITGDYILISQGSRVEATGPTNDRNGTVIIGGPDGEVSEALAALPESFLDAASLMQAGCGAARAGLSSLVEVGRGGLPPDPDDYLPSLDPGAAAGRGDGAGAGQASLPERFAAGPLAFAPASECPR